MRARLIIAAVLALSPTLTAAAETITYSYDAKGRLTQVAHVGGRNDRLTSSYAFDAADNRTAARVSGAPGHVIIVPLGSLRTIPIG